MAALRFLTKGNIYWKATTEHLLSNNQLISDERNNLQSVPIVKNLSQLSNISQVDQLHLNNNGLLSSYGMNMSHPLNCKPNKNCVNQQKLHVNSIQNTSLLEKPCISSKLQLKTLLIPRAYLVQSYSTNNSFNKSPKKFIGNTNLSHSSKSDDNTESVYTNYKYCVMLLTACACVCGISMYLITCRSSNIGDFIQKIKDQHSDTTLPLACVKHGMGKLNLVKKSIVEPSSMKLLPDQLQKPYYQPPYTLVIELTDVFLKPEYDSVSGWRFKKRPGTDYFLSQVGPPFYEIVIFTKETGNSAFPLIRSMDQNGCIMYSLFRDAARYKSGFSYGNPLKGELPKLDPYYQKDLKYLNRDLKKVVLVDCEKRAFETQPENSLYLEKWDGSSDDTTLYDLAGLLRAISGSNVEDVRPILQHYAQDDKPVENFRLFQARMQQERWLDERSVSTSDFITRAVRTVSPLVRKR